MQITWWEWEELESAIQERHDLWEPVPDRANIYFRVALEQPLYALTAFPAPGTGDFRLVELKTQALNWVQAEVEQHLIYMRDKFTSFPFRLAVENFLKEELHMDEKTAYKAAIIIARMEQGPLLAPKIEAVEGDPLPALATFRVNGSTDSNLHGTISFHQQGDMLRARMCMWRRTSVTGGEPILLDGFLRIRGISTEMAVTRLTGASYIEPLSYEEKQLLLGLGEGATASQLEETV